MSFYYLFIIALIQGFSEFLPISSSGHLVLLPGLLKQQDQGLFIDVAVHVGTLGAVVAYFWRDVRMAFFGFLGLFFGITNTQGARLAIILIIATLPVIVVGLFLKLTGLDEMLRSMAVIGWTTLLFGILLYWVDQSAQEIHVMKEWKLRQAIVLGLWQALALIPGTSRSGITITGARQMGFKRIDATRIAMLMSIPTIIASGSLLGVEAIAQANWAMIKFGALAVFLSFITGFIALVIMMRLLRIMTFTPYVIYRVILGLVILFYVYT